MAGPSRSDWRFTAAGEPHVPWSDRADFGAPTPTTASASHRCRAQATAMARQADATLRTPLRIHATREKALAVIGPAAKGRPGYRFRATAVAAPAPDRAEASQPWPAEPALTEAGIAAAHRRDVACDATQSRES